MLRRLLLATACVLALASAGCVEITNPQFDARYRTAVRPVPKPPYAVFAIHEQGPVVGSARSTVLVVDTAKRSVVASVTLLRVVALSDVGGPADRRSVLVAFDNGFGQIDLGSGESTRLPTASLPFGRPERAAFDDKGIRVFWQSAEGDLRFLVSRRIGANEQTAAVDFRDVFGPDVARGWGGLDMMLLSADEREAYFVNQGSAPSTGAAAFHGSKGYRAATVWRADFATHAISQVGSATPWPKAFVPYPAVHPERAIRRWGVPADAGGGRISFLGRGGKPQAILDTTTVGTPVSPRVVFEPGGERYLELRRVSVPFEAGVFSWAVAERSLAATGTRVVYQQQQPPPDGGAIEPLGVIAGEMFAYGLQRRDGEPASTAQRDELVPAVTYEIHLLDLDTGADAVVSVFGSRRYATPTAEYLGSFIGR